VQKSIDWEAYSAKTGLKIKGEKGQINLIISWRSTKNCLEIIRRKRIK
jgi:hypothetical protein